MALSRALFSAAAPFRHCAQIHGRLRDARFSAARHRARKRSRTFACRNRQFLEDQMKLARCIFLASAVAMFFVKWASATPADNAKAMQIYCIDVEGGQATLFVMPQGESLLI